MVLKWKNDKIEEKYDNFGMPTQLDIPLDPTLSQIKKFPVRRFVEKKERYCKDCNIAESHVRGIKKIKKYLDKGYVRLVKNFVDSLDPKTLFTVRELLVNLDASNLSDGSLQRKALSILVLLGYLNVQTEEYKNKKGKIMHKFVYRKNLDVIPKPCYDKENDEHHDNWRSAREERYFQ